MKNITSEQIKNILDGLIVENVSVKTYLAVQNILMNLPNANLPVTTPVPETKE